MEQLEKKELKSFVDTLEFLYELVVDESDHDFPRDNPEVKRFIETYSLSEGSALSLAMLMHSYPNSLSRHAINTVIEAIGEDPFFVIARLKRERFIVYDSGMRIDCILAQAAYEAFCEEKPFGSNVIDDCVKELTSCSVSKIFNEKWLVAFYNAMEKSGNEHLRKATSALKIDRKPKDIQLAFWVIAHYFAKYFTTPLKSGEVEELLSGVTYGEEELISGLKELVKDGIVVTLPKEEEESEGDKYLLAHKVAGMLFHGHDELIKYDELAKFGTIIKASAISKKKLFFSSESKDAFENLRKVLSHKGFIRACRILKSQNRNQAIHCLFWGGPGTGKTESVKQIARESGRDIVLFDVSKVTSSAWGATEKCYRGIFRAYSYVSEISTRVPILLMNEADAVLSRRITSIDRAIDKAENAVSNILLQEFEDMSGILLATTNLITNLDDAFDRRFLFKIHLENPDAEARASIWRSVIPSLSEEEAIILAEKFEMSGAQINNVATKRQLAELYYDGDRGVEYIEKLCQNELASDKGNNTCRKKIGF